MIISIPLLIVAAVRDLVKKTSVLLFDLDQHMSSAYSEFNSSFEQAALANRIWHVQSQAAVFDRKYHSGAASSSQHRTYSTNESVGAAAQKQQVPPSIKLGGRTFFFFPDRVVACDQHGYGVIRYSALNWSCGEGHSF